MPPTPIPADALNAPVEGRNLAPGPLGHQWGDRPSLLVFLRHLGCIFCREVIWDLRAVRDSDPDFPDIVYLHIATLAQGDDFFKGFDPDARAIADPSHSIYDAFGVKNAKLSQIISPSVIACGVKATLKGNRQTGLVGDPRKMPGFFLVKGDQILWSYNPRHIADHPNFSEIRKIAVASDPTPAI